MRLLISGFVAFGENSSNPTQALLPLLPRELDGCVIETLLLPVEFGRAGELLCRRIDALDPDAVLSLGLAASRAAISVERLAVNLIDARIPDNAGRQPVDARVAAEGATAYFTAFPVRRIARAITDGGFPAELSATAGLYVCNAVYYAALQHMEQQKKPGAALFIHVPQRDERMLLAPLAAGIAELIACLREGTA